MKDYVQREVTRTENVLVVQRCDLCDRKADKTDCWSGGIFNIDETEITATIKQKEGSSCPDGGYGTTYEIDMCPDCFKNRLIPWLVSQGAKVEQKEWDW